MSEARLPWFKFYPADWLKDPSLSACSLAAQGAWMRLVCHMHESSPRGYLKDSNGQPFTDRHIARLIGSAPQTARKIVSELMSLGVVSVTENDSETPGVLYSRRMVRDDLKLQQDIENGRKGGNAILKNGLTPRLTTPSPKGLRLDSDTDIDSKTEASSAPSTNHQSAPPPTPKPSPTVPKGWEEVEEGLSSLNLSMKAKAIESARQHGFNPPQVLALVKYLAAKPSGCDDPARAIYNRLVDHAADAVSWDCDENWPWSHVKPNRRSKGMGSTEDFDAVFEAAVKHPADPESLARNVAVRTASEAALVDALEATLADELDQLSDDSLTTMCAAVRREASPAMRDAKQSARSKLVTYGREDPRTRAALLMVLDLNRRRKVVA